MSEIPTFKFAIREDLQDVAEKFLPTKAEPHATGWDVACAQPDRQPIILRAGQYIKIPLGFRAFPANGYWFELKPRSSTFVKKELHALYGTIDSTYESELIFAAQYLADIGSLGQDLTLNFGDKIAQIIPIKLQEMHVENISNEEYDILCQRRNAVRKTGGFGSSDSRK